MKNTRFYIGILVAIVATGLLTRAHGLLPKRSLDLIPHAYGQHYLASNPRKDRSDSGTWIDEDQRRYRCTFADEDFSGHFFCSFVYSLELERAHGGQDLKEFDEYNINRVGVDLSDYDTLKVDIDYSGPASHIRIFLRNYSEKYSKSNDGNSTKFIALLLNADVLNTPTKLNMDKFSVSDWWLAQYNIPQSLSSVELKNIVSFWY